MSGTAVPDKRWARHRSRCLYRRLGGARYLYLVLSAGPLAVVLVTPPAAAFFDFVWARASMGDWGRTLAFAIPWMALVAVFAGALGARSALPLLDWVREAGPAKDASAARRAALTRMPRALELGTAVVMIGALLPTYYAVAQAGDPSAGLIAAAFLAIAAFIVIAAVFMYYVVCRPLLAPVIADMSSQLVATPRWSRAPVPVLRPPNSERESAGAARGGPAEARREVERDLYDELQRQLLMMKTRLGPLARQLADDPAAAKRLAELRADIERTLAVLRVLGREMWLRSEPGRPRRLAGSPSRLHRSS